MPKLDNAYLLSASGRGTAGNLVTDELHQDSSNYLREEREKKNTASEAKC